MAKRQKKPAHKVVMAEDKRNIIQQLIQDKQLKTFRMHLKILSGF